MKPEMKCIRFISVDHRTTILSSRIADSNLAFRMNLNKNGQLPHVVVGLIIKQFQYIEVMSRFAIVIICFVYHTCQIVIRTLFNYTAFGYNFRLFLSSLHFDPDKAR
jgi:ABC-type uncharacterized transport system permease subunit